MKIDLLTIFPGIVLKTRMWGHGGKEVKDPDAYDDFVFKDARIFSYKRLQTCSDILDKNQLDYFYEINSHIVDSNGNQLTDYTIILNKIKNIDIGEFKPPTPDSQQLITYFSYLQGLDLWTSPNFIKILYYQSGGVFTYINNKYIYGIPKYLFLQGPGAEIKIHKNIEKQLIDILTIISKKDINRYKRFINAITLFNESCRINRFNPNSSVVLIVSAFESLLELPIRPKKENFVYAFKLLWGFDEYIWKWANELYVLRSQIVHGGVTEGEKLMASEDRHYPHFEIARDMFPDSLWLLLEASEGIRIDPEQKLDVKEYLRNKIISNKKKVEDILKSKNRFSYKAFVRKRDLYKEFILRIEELTAADYSAQNEIKKLLDLIFSITKDWIEAEDEKDRKTTDNRLMKSITEYLQFKNEKLQNVLKLFDEITEIKWSPKNKFQISKKISEIIEEVRPLEPVIHQGDEFLFTIPEFLDRCLGAVKRII